MPSPPSHARPHFVGPAQPEQPLVVVQLPDEAAPPCQNGLVLVRPPCPSIHYHDDHREFGTSQEDHVVDDPIAHGEKHQVAVGEDRQVATTSLASSAWPVLQRWVEECHEAAREKATRHIQKCLRSQMVEQWAEAAAVRLPPLVFSSSDDERDPMELRMHQRNLSSGSEEETTSSSEDDGS